MKLRKLKNNQEPPTKLEKPKPKKKKFTLTRKEIITILIFLILFIILFIIIPMKIYGTGALESTNYYYKLPSVV